MILMLAKFVADFPGLLHLFLESHFGSDPIRFLILDYTSYLGLYLQNALDSNQAVFLITHTYMKGLSLMEN